MAAVGQPFGKTGSKVILHQVVAVARIGDTVVGMQQPFQRTAHLFAFVRPCKNQVVFGRRPRERAVRDVLQQHLFTHRGRVEQHQVVLFLAHHRVVELAAAGHPAHPFAGVGQYYATGLHLGQLAVTLGTLHIVAVRIAGQQILAVRRKIGPIHTGTEIGIEQGETALHIG